MVRATETAGSIVVWDVAAAKALHTISVDEPPYAVTAAFSEDSTRVAIRLPGPKPPVTVRDLKTGRELARLDLPRSVHPSQLEFADGGRTLIVTGRPTVGYGLPDGKELFAWNMAPEPSPTNIGVGVVGGGGIMTEAERLAWRTIAVSPDGSLAGCVLSAGWTREAKLADRIALCDARTGKVLRRWGDSGRQSNGYEVLAFSADGRLLASSDKYDVHVWEVATGKKVRTFRGHRNEIESLTFSGNGRRLASAAHDSTVLVWDVPPAGKPDVDLWADLASDDPTAAYAAVGRLADAADDVTIPLLRKHLRPVTAADGERIRKLVANLDSDEFRTREQAFKELLDLGLAARPALKAAQEKKPSAEMAGRVEQLLAKVVGPPSSGESLRTGRALAALEMKGTPAAAGLLRELAAGADGWLTAEARAAVNRMER
jgi:hypothetical protein